MYILNLIKDLKEVVSVNSIMLLKLRLIIGWIAIISPLLHILSDLLEVFGGGFAASQLWINYLAFLPIPFLMIGLYAFQRPRSNWMSLTGAVFYGTSFIFLLGQLCTLWYPKQQTTLLYLMN